MLVARAIVLQVFTVLTVLSVTLASASKDQGLSAKQGGARPLANQSIGGAVK